MKTNSPVERLYNGIIKENPTFVMMIGMCPTLAVTTSATNGIGMGLTTLVILTLSNMMISLLRKMIPDGVRMPAYIGVVASFVTIVQLLLEGYIPELYDALGIYIPLIVVNCIILGRAEAFAGKNKVIPSIFDGLGMGIGFTIGLTSIGAVRELIGAGQLFGFQILPASYEPVTIFIMAPGAFLVLALLVAVQNYVKNKKAAKGQPVQQSSCGQGCGKLRKYCLRRQEIIRRGWNERIIDDSDWLRHCKQRGTEPVPGTLSFPWCIQEDQYGSRNGRRGYFRTYHFIPDHQPDL